MTTPPQAALDYVQQKYDAMLSYAGRYKRDPNAFLQECVDEGILEPGDTAKVQAVLRGEQEQEEQAA